MRSITPLRRVANPISDFRRNFDRLLTKAFEPWELDEDSPSYPIDIREDDRHVYVDAELPGFKKEEVSVMVDNGMLTISAERSNEEHPGHRKHLTERHYQRIERTVALPAGVDDEKADAKLEGGVLHLTLTKPEDQKRHTIPIS
jgi:HSP20 family protein